MPESMKKNYPNHAATFDCFEVATEIPSKVAHSVLAYSHYKSGFTIKVLGATSAAGVFMFMSEGYGGRTTDSQIVVGSGVMKKARKDDQFLADKGTVYILGQ